MKITISFLLTLVVVIYITICSIEKKGQPKEQEIFGQTSHLIAPHHLTVTQNRTFPEEKLEQQRASHPKVKYLNPGRIRSFSDSKLLEAFNIYFSLIGEDRNRFKFSQSGFDTDYNAALTFETIKNFNYERGNPSKTQFQTSILAITLLAHSELPSSARYREQLAEWLAEKMDQTMYLPSAKWYRADLKLLLELYPTNRMDEVIALYHRTKNQTIKNSIAAGLQGNFRHRNQDEISTNNYLNRAGVIIWNGSGGK